MEKSNDTSRKILEIDNTSELSSEAKEFINEYKTLCGYCKERRAENIKTT